MVGIQHAARASYAFIERNFNIVKRYWAWELVWLVYGIVNSLSVSFIGVGMGALGATATQSQNMVIYLAIGTIVWRYLSVIFYWVTDVIGIERWEGYFRAVGRGGPKKPGRGGAGSGFRVALATPAGETGRGPVLIVHGPGSDVVRLGRLHVRLP